MVWDENLLLWNPERAPFGVLNGWLPKESNMVKEDVLKEIKTKLSKKILKVYEKSPRQTYIDLKPEDILSLSKQW